MKKLIAMIAVLALVLSLTACFGTGSVNNNGATADEANAADVSTYDKDFDGLQKYITDRNTSAVKAEIYYDILGANNGVRYVLNSNAFVEIYDFSNADNETAKAILADVKDDGKFSPMENSAEMTAIITDSGKFLLAWDATRSYDYTNKVATDELKSNW